MLQILNEPKLTGFVDCVMQQCYHIHHVKCLMIVLIIIVTDHQLSSASCLLISVLATEPCQISNKTAIDALLPLQFGPRPHFRDKKTTERYKIRTTIILFSIKQKYCFIVRCTRNRGQPAVNHNCI